jgi:hypothetical protein
VLLSPITGGALHLNRGFIQVPECICSGCGHHVQAAVCVCDLPRQWSWYAECVGCASGLCSWAVPAAIGAPFVIFMLQCRTQLVPWLLSAPAAQHFGLLEPCHLWPQLRIACAAVGCVCWAGQSALRCIHQTLHSVMHTCLRVAVALRKFWLIFTWSTCATEG